MPPDPLTTALIGCGRIGTRTRPELAKILPPGWLPLSHADAIKTVHGLDLVALCDSSAENLKLAAESHGVTRLYSDAGTLIREVRPKVLSIATRTPGRCDIVVDAARNGVKGMHIEKPISTNLRDARRALDAVVEHHVVLSYGTTRRYMEIYNQALDRVRGGEIGDLVEIRIQSGRTTLLWNHPHSIDLMLFYSGTRAVESVEARCEIRDGAASGDTIDDDPLVDTGTVAFSNGVRGVIVPEEGSNVLLIGSKGKVTIGGDGGWIETQGRRVEARSCMSGTARAFVGLESAVRSGTPAPMPPEDIYAAQQILLAIALSGLRGGGRTLLTDIKPEFTVTGRSGSLTA